MKRYRQLLEKYFDELIAGSFAAGAAGFLFIGMGSRICFQEPLLWTEEAVMLCFVWAIFLGIAAVYKREIHIGADMLIRNLSEDRKRIVRTLVCLILTIINGTLFWLSIEYTISLVEKRLPMLGISCGWMGAAMVLSFGLCTWYSICSLLFDKRTGRKRGEA